MHNSILCNILLISNDTNKLALLKDFLVDIQCNVIVATSKIAAFQQLKDNDIILILFLDDLNNPAKLEIIEKISFNKNTSNIPIMSITTRKTPMDLLNNGYELGIVDYLYEPVNPLALISKVNFFVKIYQQTILLKNQSLLLENQIEQLIQLRDKNNELENLSFSDSLTGIANRRHFDNYYQRVWDDAYLTNTPISLIMCDIDDFKKYNDHHGHLAGDKCLIKIANSIFKSLHRPTDLMARYGGEEFIIVLPNTDEKRVLRVAKKIRRDLNKLNDVDLKKNDIKNITLSYGVATRYPDSNISREEFINITDTALYQAKSSGKDKIIVSNG